MPFVDINRLKGNYASSLVSAWLSRTCLVRPVAEGTDIGIDFFCESIIESTPFLHFWVQVKTIPFDNIKRGSADNQAWFDFERRHLQYWQRQPIPVYVLLVPLTGWPSPPPEEIFIVCITRHLVRFGLPEKESIRVWSDGSFVIGNIDKDLELFTQRVVPWDSQALLLQHGIVSPLPQYEESVERRYPAGIGFRYLGKVLETVIDASIIGILDSLIVEASHPEYKALRKRFEAIVSMFETNLSPLGISSLVRAAHSDGQVEKARRILHDAIRRVEADSALDPQEQQRLATSFKELLRELE